MFGSSVCNTLILTTMKSEFTEENSNGTVPTDYIYSNFNISNNIICNNHSQENKKLWRILFSAELIPLLISIGLMIYYNNLPGYGFMPGLTYLGEILFSFGAVVLYCISFLISICSYIAISNKQT